MTEKWFHDLRLDAGVIITSRVRLARNVKKYPFRGKQTQDNQINLIDDVFAAVKSKKETLFKDYLCRLFHGLPAYEREMYVNKHIVSPEFSKVYDTENRCAQALVLSPDEKIAIMVNEEDHIRLQAIAPGGDMAGAWEAVNAVDDALEESVDYAFDDAQFGYLTSCPTNTGTGLRASYMIHIPLLETAGEFRGFLPAISKFGMTVRGTYGEGSKPVGGIYQISNQTSIGKSEEEIISALNALTKQIIDSEQALREKMKANKAIETKDKVYRALGILQNCRMISENEMMELLSALRLGLVSGFFERITKDGGACFNETIYSVMINAQNGSLQFEKGRPLNQKEADIARADYLRSVF